MIERQPLILKFIFLIREAFATIPPTVEYSLTEKGKKLEPVLAELYKWGKEYA